MKKPDHTDASSDRTASVAPERSGNEVIGSTVAPHPDRESLAAEAANAKPSATREQIAIAAYYLAERRGFEPGYEIEDWLEAERELIATATTLARGVR